MKLTITGAMGAGKILSAYYVDFDVAIAIRGRGEESRAPEGFDEFEGKKLLLTFDDCLVPSTKRTRIPPTKEEIAEFVEFCKTVPDDVKVLINCGAGISRSTACAFILLCIKLGPNKEQEAMDTVANIRDCLHPNELIVQFGDELLERKGRMIETLKNLNDRMAENRGIWTPSSG